MEKLIRNRLIGFLLIIVAIFLFNYGITGIFIVSPVIGMFLIILGFILLLIGIFIAVLGSVDNLKQSVKITLQILGMFLGLILVLLGIFVALLNIGLGLLLIIIGIVLFWVLRMEVKQHIKPLYRERLDIIQEDVGISRITS